MTKNVYDFTDISDLPEELQGKLERENTEGARTYADIVIKGAEAGAGHLNINQIEAVARRLGLKVPTQTTIRNHLNKAVELGLICKPTRQSYGVVGSVVEDEPEVEHEDFDPLADL